MLPGFFSLRPFIAAQKVILNNKTRSRGWDRTFIQVEFSGFFSPLTRFLSKSRVMLPTY